MAGKHAKSCRELDLVVVVNVSDLHIKSAGLFDIDVIDLLLGLHLLGRGFHLLIIVLHLIGRDGSGLLGGGLALARGGGLLARSRLGGRGFGGSAGAVAFLLLKLGDVLPVMRRGWSARVQLMGGFCGRKQAHGK